MSVPSCAAVILAAGPSTRLGRPKQLLCLGGQTLLRRAARTALDSNCDAVIVVLGAQVERLRAEVEDLPIRIVHNAHWMEGIASSLRAGVQAAIESEAESVLIALADQPLVTAAHLNALIALRRKGAPVVATAYAGTVGVPALFDRAVYPELLALHGDVGAKPVLALHAATVVSVTFPDAASDVDRPEDVDALRGLDPL